MKIGFSIEPAQEAPTLTLPVPEPSKPVRSLVQVRFEGDGRLLTYYNDLFDLAPGDRVFVSGKLAGIPGTVEKITTKFKINLSNYERVISMARIEIHGSYEKLIDKMVSYDSIALSPDQFRAWAKPPRAEEESRPDRRKRRLSPETVLKSIWTTLQDLMISMKAFLTEPSNTAVTGMWHISQSSTGSARLSFTARNGTRSTSGWTMLCLLRCTVNARIPDYASILSLSQSS